MRLAAFGLELRAVLGRQLQRGAVVDRRQAARELALAAAVELVGGLVAGIEPADVAQAVGGGVIEREPLRLPDDEVGHDAEPGEVLRDRIGEFGLRARQVGVVVAQQEAPAMAAREQPVEQRRPGVADMQVAGRRRREADERSGHGGAYDGFAGGRQSLLRDRRLRTPPGRRP